MKKLIYCAAALVTALFAGSCQRELLDPAGGNGTVTYTVQVPEIGTKALGDDVTVINDLVYAVYRTTKNSLQETLDNWETATHLVYDKNVEGQAYNQGKTTVSLELINNQNYVILFWAQKDDAWVAGEDFDLTKITYPADPEGNVNMVVNIDDVADKYAAFSGVEFLAAGDFAGQKTAILTRPFAQINIAAKDPVNYDVNVTGATITVKNVGNEFNVAKKSAATTKDQVTYTWTKKPETSEFSVNNVAYEHYVAMNYIFAKNNVKVAYDIHTEKHGTVSNEIINVPVEKNYRTNIVGNLLTSNVDYNVELNQDWGQPELAPEEIYLAAALGGEVTLEEDITLTAPLEVKAEMTINLNGYTISGKIEKGNGAIVNIADGASVILNGGTIENTALNGDAAINNEGTLVLNGVTIKGAPLADGGYSAYAVISSGNMVIEEGTAISADRGSIKVTGAGETVINGGTFTNNDIGSRSLTSHVVDVESGSTHKLTINGGTFQHLHTTTSGGVVICNRTTGTVYVNGGNFSGGNYYGNDNLSDYGYGGTFSVKGGVFSANPAAKYIAEGYKTIEKDGKYYVVTNNTVSTSEELDTAIKNAAEGYKIMLLDGTYGIDEYKAGVTIIGAGENVTLDIQDKIFDVNGTATIENVKVVFSNNGYKGFQGGVDLNFKECIIEGQPFLYGTKATFEGCTFVQNDPEQYNIWTYAVLEANFIDCVFNCAGKSILVYGEANDLVQKVNFEGCTFNASTPYNGKAAIEIGTSQLTTGMYNVTINDTDVNNFANGSVSGNPVWNVKNGNRANVIVDGEVCYVGGADEVSDGLWKNGTIYSVTNAEGLASINSAMANNTAGVGITINLLSDIDFTGKTWTPVRSHIDWKSTMNEFNGNGYTISNLTINGAAMFSIFANNHDVVVKNVTFDNAKVTCSGINSAIIVGQTYNNLLLENVDVNNSVISGNYKVAALVGTVYNESTSTITATLKDCDVTNTTVKSTQYDFCTAGMVSFVYASDNDKIEFENCTISNVKLYGPTTYGYKAHAAVYTTGSETLFNEAEGVTVTNVTFENI